MQVTKINKPIYYLSQIDNHFDQKRPYLLDYMLTKRCPKIKGNYKYRYQAPCVYEVTCNSNEFTLSPARLAEGKTCIYTADIETTISDTLFGGKLIDQIKYVKQERETYSMDTTLDREYKMYFVVMDEFKPFIGETAEDIAHRKQVSKSIAAKRIVDAVLKDSIKQVLEDKGFVLKAKGDDLCIAFKDRFHANRLIAAAMLPIINEALETIGMAAETPYSNRRAFKIDTAIARIDPNSIVGTDDEN